MTSQSSVIRYAPMQSIDSTTFTGSFIPIGTATNPAARIFKIVNDSNVTVIISTDGITPHDVLPSTTFVLYDIGTNRGNSASETVLAPTQFYASASAGTGLLYIITLFAYTPQMTIPL